MAKNSKSSAKAAKQPKTNTKAAGKNAKNAKGGKDQKVSFFGRIKQFFKDLRSEIKKIVWSTGKDTLKNTLVVLMVVLVVGIGVWVADAILVKLREVIYNASVTDAETAIIAVKALIGMYL